MADYELQRKTYSCFFPSKNNNNLLVFFKVRLEDFEVRKGWNIERTETLRTVYMGRIYVEFV